MSTTSLSNTVRFPVITSKAYQVAEKGNWVVFKVLKDANKLQVKKAVEQMFKVEVETVNILNTKPKQKRSGKSRKVGYTKSYKKAYVKLKQGQEIDFGTDA